MHLDVEQVERLVAGELTANEAGPARAHVAACTACGARVEAARSADAIVSDLLRHIDRAPPRVSAQSIMSPPSRSRSGWGARAAGILALLGVAAAAYALPGSPVRKWLVGERAASANPVAAAPEVVSGIAVEPGRNLVIAFARTQAAGEVHVVLSDSAVVAVSSRSEAAAFSSEEGRLAVDNHDPAATFDVMIPRAAARVEIRVGNRSLFLKEGTRITANAPAPDGSYHLSLQQ
jgi:hypothetical protein